MLLSLWYVLGLLSESTLPCYLSVYFYLGLTFAFLPLAVDPLFFQRRVSWRAIFMCIGVYFWSQQLNICVSYSGPNGCDQRTSMFIYASTCL